jgi:predicted metal-dependent enzyme (double-stranded beta helix superfamily)
MTNDADRIAPLRDFVRAMTRLVDRTDDEPALLAGARPLLAALIADDAWLPEACTTPDPQFYRQYLLHCDPLERFSVVSFVWGPGQKTPVHDHTVWGLVGMLRGAERCRRYDRKADGTLRPIGEEQVLKPGEIEAVSPRVGDIHTVANALADRPSISIHVYGANIGAVRRHVFDPATGAAKDFVSGYSAATVPNLWDRSAVVRAALS